MDIIARNKQFLKFMESIYPEVELCGSFHRPKPVVKVDGQYFTLPCFVNNYMLILLDNVIDGKQVGKVRLQWEVTDEILGQLTRWKDGGYPIKRCYFIRLAEDELYLQDISLRESVVGEKLEPTFSFEGKKIFLNYKDAIMELDRIDPSKRGNLIIV